MRLPHPHRRPRSRAPSDPRHRARYHPPVPPLLRLWFATCLGVLTLSGCAGRNERTAKPGQGRPGVHELSGHASYEAHHRTRWKRMVPRESKIPDGHSPIAGLKVCLYRQKGSHDLRMHSRIMDDERVGCVMTDPTGGYRFEIPLNDCPRHGDCSRRYYVATDLCTWREGKPQACVAANTNQGKTVGATNWKEDAEWRKFMWSNTYRFSLTDRKSHLLSWNLSCPREAGNGREDVECPREPKHGYFDRAHSNLGYNDESLHAFVAGAGPSNRFGSMVPDAKNSFNANSGGCASNDLSRQRRRECRDAMRIVVRKLRRIGMDPRVCDRKDESVNRTASRRTICIGSPYNAFIIVHELGHVVHLRWMNYKGGINGGGKVNWKNGTPEKAQVGEGWANFFSAAVWYDPAARAPSFDSQNIERIGGLECPASGNAPGEGPSSAFFWDLFDPASVSEPEDSVQIDMRTLIETWSLFPGKDGSDRRDRTKGECNPHGRNLWDYRYYLMKHPSHPREVAPLMHHNCVGGQVRTTTCR